MPNAMKSDLVDIEMMIHKVSERAVLASTDGAIRKAVWLPLSQVEVCLKDNSIAEVTMPEWLAIEKGLV